MQDHRTDIWQHINTTFTSDTLELGGKNKQLYELLHLQFQENTGLYTPLHEAPRKLLSARWGAEGISRSQAKPNCENMLPLLCHPQQTHST